MVVPDLVKAIEEGKRKHTINEQHIDEQKLVGRRVQSRWSSAPIIG